MQMWYDSQAPTVPFCDVVVLVMGVFNEPVYVVMHVARSMCAPLRLPPLQSDRKIVQKFVAVIWPVEVAL